MTKHLYASLIPEALIASMLPPEEFGAYYAVGTRKKARGQALFVEVDPAFRHPAFRIDEGLERCVPHPDGEPKRSLYIAVYRVFEHLPVSAFGALQLVTQDGRVIALDGREPPTEADDGLHLYQEICPVNPMVASTLGPVDFYRFLSTSASLLFALPALCFADLRLGELAADPECGDAGELPYANIEHLRQCLADIRAKPRATKMVDRNHSVVFPYRTVRTGFYFGKGADLHYYPMPSREELLARHFTWWRSAQS